MSATPAPARALTVRTCPPTLDQFVVRQSKGLSSSAPILAQRISGPGFPGRCPDRS